MKTMIPSTLLMVLLADLFCLRTFLVHAESELPQARLVFIEETNGLFSVGQFNSDRLVIQRWRGVSLGKEQLPPTSPFSMAMIVFARGARPAFATNANAGDYWNPSNEQLYHYGDIPYAVEDIDPVVTSYRDTNGHVHVGFRLRGRFYAVTNLGYSAFSEGAAKRSAISGSHLLNPPLVVVPVVAPHHRRSEIRAACDAIRTADHLLNNLQSGESVAE